MLGQMRVKQGQAPAIFLLVLFVLSIVLGYGLTWVVSKNPTSLLAVLLPSGLFFGLLYLLLVQK